MCCPGNEPTRVSGEWDRLELAVRRLLDEHTAAKGRVREVEARIMELEGALRRVSSGDIDPLALAARAEELAAENKVLRERLEVARDKLNRLLRRLRFVEDVS